MTEMPVQCHVCGLFKTCKTPFMEPDESGVLEYQHYTHDCDILVIGEAPGSQEDDQGIPFVGQSGTLIRDGMSEVGLDSYSVAFTNVIRCRPPKNKTPNKKQIKACYDAFLKDEIEYYSPRLIILLGNVPLGAVLGESGITNWHGVIIDWSYGDTDEDVWVVPCYHPAYVLRNMSILPDFVDDLEKCFDLLGGLQDTDRADDGCEVITDVMWPDASKSKPVGCIHTAILDAVEAGSLVGFDTEDTSLRVWDKDQEVIVCSFAVNKPFKKAWVTDDWDVVRQILEDPDIPKVGHNIKFDMQAVFALLDIWPEGVVGDSMLLSYILDPVPGRHGLKVLAGRHLGMYDYDKGLQDYVSAHKDADPKRGGTYGNVPLEILSEYAANDAIATLELHDKLYAELTDAQRVLYDELIIPANNALAVVESNGCAIDEEVVLSHIEAYGDVHAEQLEIMQGDPIIQQFTADMIAGRLLTTKKQEDAKKLKKVGPRKKFAFNPNSTDQMREILFARDYCGLKSVGLTNAGQLSTRWDLIKVYVNEVDFLPEYRYYKLLNKMLSTYLRPVLPRWCSNNDGRTRANYNIHGTVTGRLSSSQPNLQNIPTPEKEPGTVLERLPIKDIFTHTWEGGCLLAVDYAGMELRTMASVSDCQGMKQAFEDGIDVHSFVTELLYGVRRDDFAPKDWKAMRYRAKWVNWTLLFGGSWYTLHNLYGINEAEAKRLVDTYYGNFPEVLDFKEETLEFARANGYVESPFGRRRYLPYINDSYKAKRLDSERGAINMPIQSAASDVLLSSIIVINDIMQQDGYNSLMVNTVHDSIMFDVYPGELNDLVWLCLDVMENMPRTYCHEYFPGLDYSWFTVPLKADCEVGSHYGSVEHYEVQ